MKKIFSILLLLCLLPLSGAVAQGPRVAICAYASKDTFILSMMAELRQQAQGRMELEIVSAERVRAEIVARAPETRHAARVREALSGPQSAIILVDDLTFAELQSLNAGDVGAYVVSTQYLTDLQAIANGRAVGMGAPQGFVKMIACAKTDRILGVHIIGNNASELIAEAVVTMEFAGASEDLGRICHAHPTLSEIVHEAALACDKRALHF